MRYTARDGGGLLRKSAVTALKKAIAAGTAAGSMRLFSVRHEFPSEWAKFTAQVPPQGQRHQLKLTLRPEHYPFWSQGQKKSVKRVDVLARSTRTPIPGSVDMSDIGKTPPITDEEKLRIDQLSKDMSRGGLLAGTFKQIPLPAPDGEFSIFIDDNSFGDLWIGFTWGAA